MRNALKREVPHEIVNVMRSAVVVAKGEDNLLHVRLEGDEGLRTVWAMPLAGGGNAAPGDTVLVAGEHYEACYVLGILKRAKTAPRKPEAIVTREGATAHIVPQDEGESIQVRDTQNRLLFSYNPQSGKSVLSVAAGDLVLQAPQGNIDLLSGKNVRFWGPQQVSIMGGQSVTLATPALSGRLKSALRLGPQNLDLSGQDLRLTAQQADFLVGSGRYQGRTFSATLQSAHLIADKLETLANRIVQRARELFSYVQDISQLKAGRRRTVVKDSYHLKSRRSYIKAEEEIKIDGSRIDLG